MAYADKGPASSVMSRSFAHLFDDGTDAAGGAGGAGGGDQWQLPVQHQGTAVTRKVSAATAAGKVPEPLISALSTGNLRQTLDHGEPGDRERPLAATRQREDDPYGLYPDGNSQSISARANGTDDDAGRHSKRPRMALSCSECKRRKIKCDRNVPCTACIKRGRSAYCNWDEAKIDPAPQPFVLRSELQELRDRVQILESLVKAAPSGGDHAQPDVVPCHGMQAQTIQEQEGRQGRPDRQDREDQRQKNKEKECSERSSEDGKYNDNVEDAAIILESIAFNPPRDASADRPIISHEYWRGSLMAPPTSDCRPGGHCETPGAATTGTTAVKKDHIFLTAALTSIIAPTWDAVVDRYNPLLSNWDDEFKDWTRQERENHGRQQQRARLRKKREDVLDAIYAALPTVRQSYYLANQYQKTVDWRSHILYWPGFQAELKTFWELMAQGRHLDIDPLWLAVFFMVMALALDNQRADEVDVMADINHPFHGYRSQHFKDLTNRCHAISIRALHLGNPMATPRVRTIQTIILLNQFFQSSAARGQADMMLNWIGVAIRSAQLMGLHILGSNPEIMPPDDPAWPPGKNAIKRHVALRIWMILQWADWMSASARFRSYIIHPEQCTSQLIDNVNDSELSCTDWKYEAHDPNQITSASFEIYKWKIANMLRMTYDKFITHADKFSYSSVLEVDRGYQAIFDHLPEAYQPSAETNLSNEDPKIRWQRNLALEGIYSRIVRLHRPFLSRGYSPGSRYKYSKDQCLRSARIVVDCHSNMRDLTTRGMFWFTYSHTLGAATVLFLDLFWSIDHDLPPDEIADRFRIISIVQGIFSKFTDIINPSLRTVVESAYHIITDLSSEGQARQATHSSRSQQDPQQKPESFTEIFRRVSMRVGTREVSTTKRKKATSSSVTATTTSSASASASAYSQQSFERQPNNLQAPLSSQQHPSSTPATSMPQPAAAAGASLASDAFWSAGAGTDTAMQLLSPDFFGSGFFSDVEMPGGDIMATGGQAFMDTDAWAVNPIFINANSSQHLSPDGESPDLSFLFQEAGAGGQMSANQPPDNSSLWRYLVSETAPGSFGV